MTVEASLILPAALCVMAIGIYVAFFLYDRCLFYQDAYLLCMRESYRKDEGKPSVDQEEIRQASREQLGSKYFAVDDWTMDTAAEGKWSVCSGSAWVLPAVFGENSIMPQDIWEISYSACSRKTDPAWNIRSWRRKSYVVSAGLKTLVSGATEN